MDGGNSNDNNSGGGRRRLGTDELTDRRCHGALSCVVGTFLLEQVEPERDDVSLLQLIYNYNMEQQHDGGIMPEEDGGRPIISAGDVPQVVDQSAAHLTVGLQSSDASSVSQMQGGGGGGSTGHLVIDMAPHQQVPAGLQPPAPMVLIKAIWSISLLTMVTTITTAFYKPAKGAVFGHNKLAYYLLLSAILALGLGEAATAFWISRPGGGSEPRLRFGRAVLFASVFPLATALGISGYGFLQG